MYKQVYEDYKYVMQDASRIYLGAKYSFREVIDNEEIPFKLRMVTERYLSPDLDPETTLESFFYYLTAEGLSYKIFRQLKVKVKYNVLEEKKSLTGKNRREYTTKTISLEEFVHSTPEEKQAGGVVIQEIIFSKLALMAF